MFLYRQSNWSKRWGMWRAGGREDHYPPALIVVLGIALLITIAREVHLVNQSVSPFPFLQQVTVTYSGEESRNYRVFWQFPNQKNESMSRFLLVGILLGARQTASEQAASDHLLLPAMATDGVTLVQIPVKVCTAVATALYSTAHVRS